MKNKFKEWLGDTFTSTQLKCLAEDGMNGNLEIDTIRFYPQFRHEIWEIFQNERRNIIFTGFNDSLTSIKSSPDIESDFDLINTLTWYALQAAAGDIISELEGQKS